MDSKSKFISSDLNATEVGDLTLPSLLRIFSKSILFFIISQLRNIVLTQ